MFKLIVLLLLSVYITASLGNEDDGYNQKHIQGFYCVRANGVCVSGLQRCGVNCQDCNLFGSKCGFCQRSGGCSKTCKDLGGTLKRDAYMFYKRECASFAGY